jgi:hypothetical protein
MAAIDDVDNAEVAVEYSDWPGDVQQAMVPANVAIETLTAWAFGDDPSAWRDQLTWKKVAI